VRFSLIKPGEGSAILSHVVTTVCDIRAPLRSIVTGAIVGSVIGAATKLLSDPKTSLNLNQSFMLPFLIALAGQVLASVIVAVLLSRKSGAQGFITVEDFFGGAIIGLLVAYSGQDLLAKYLNQQTPQVPVK
jgi:H+/Cl- antiporter ClcA